MFKAFPIDIKPAFQESAGLNVNVLSSLGHELSIVVSVLVTLPCFIHWAHVFTRTAGRKMLSPDIFLLTALKKITEAHSFIDTFVKWIGKVKGQK